MITLKINGCSVRASKNWTILETARHHGFDIPTLCFHEAVSASGSCRLCMVEIRKDKWSKLVASCLYKVSDNLDIFTNTERVKNVRKCLFEMLLSEYPSSKNIAELAKKNGVLSSRFPSSKTEEKCFLCGLCVKVCNEVSEISAISITNRGVKKEIDTPFSKTSKICIECGRCVTICPTEAMAEKINEVRDKSDMVL